MRYNMPTMSKGWMAERRDAWLDALIARMSVPVLLGLLALVVIAPPVITAAAVGLVDASCLWLRAQKKCLPGCGFCAFCAIWRLV
jgi:hypothetical protein